MIHLKLFRESDKKKMLRSYIELCSEKSNFLLMISFKLFNQVNYLAGATRLRKPEDIYANFP